ncbi:hypothetical protein MNV49_004584 [Pseudohyphozyma bogoriensis]|nr:hypothetical protein MNV49_004584 [Pseudohyphozyma bogoriensis]
MDEPQQQAGDEYDFDEEAEAVAAANAAAEQQHRLATVLSLVPDVLPSHVLDLLERFGSAQEVINELLDDDRYPRVESSVRKGKKRARSEEGDDRSGETYEQGERDWLDAVERGQTSDEYRTHALEQLFKDYDQIGKGQIRIQFEASGHLYAHAALALDDLLEQSDDERGWALLKGRRPLPKGKGKAFRGIWELDKEKTWLRKKRAKAEEEKARAEKERLEEEELDKAEQGMLVECGCCFGEFRFALLIQCSDAHLFCKECCTTNADVQIGMSKGKLSCMADDCEAPFPESEAIRFLTSKALATLAKLRQAEEIAEAALVGLESCPFCPFACVIENPEEKLLRCERPGCEAVSCRSCKKIEHLPKTCEEFAREFSLHAVEEAMSAALVRSCPKCRQSYLKITGC